MRKKTSTLVRRGMDFASLQDAFPTFGQEPIKKKKKVRPSSLPYADGSLDIDGSQMTVGTPTDGFQDGSQNSTDPDRPAVKRMGSVAALNSSENLDNLVNQDTLFKMKSTGFNAMNSLPPPKSLKLALSPNPPSFFGAEPFQNPSEDTKAQFSNRTDAPNGYMLDADFAKSFEQTGFGKATNSPLAAPELRQRWKPLSNGVGTAFTYTPKSSQFTGLDQSDIDAMKSKLDSLMARLDDLEYRKAAENPQMEMLAFIMTGLFLMFGLDVAVRKSTGMRLLNIK